MEIKKYLVPVVLSTLIVMAGLAQQAEAQNPRQRIAAKARKLATAQRQFIKRLNKFEGELTETQKARLQELYAELGLADTDGDGVLDIEEDDDGLDKCDPDSDDDGINDGDEEDEDEDDGSSSSSSSGGSSSSSSGGSSSSSSGEDD
jgi:uncharacterized membrane protein YgcG